MPVTPLDDSPVMAAPSGTITRAPVTCVNASMALSSGPAAISNRYVALVLSAAASVAAAREVAGMTSRPTSRQHEVGKARNAEEDMCGLRKDIETQSQYRH